MINGAFHKPANIIEGASAISASVYLYRILPRYSCPYTGVVLLILSPDEIETYSFAFHLWLLYDFTFRAHKAMVNAQRSLAS